MAARRDAAFISAVSTSASANPNSASAALAAELRSLLEKITPFGFDIRAQTLRGLRGARMRQRRHANDPR